MRDSQVTSIKGKLNKAEAVVTAPLHRMLTGGSSAEKYSHAAADLESAQAILRWLARTCGRRAHPLAVPGMPTTNGTLQCRMRRGVAHIGPASVQEMLRTLGLT